MLAAVGCVIDSLGSLVTQTRKVIVGVIGLHNTHISQADKMTKNMHIYLFYYIGLHLFRNFFFISNAVATVTHA